MSISYIRIMEGILSYIVIGLLIGIVVIMLLSKLERQEQKMKRLEISNDQNRLKKQRDAILTEFNQKKLEKTEVKNHAFQLIYHFAASKNQFTLKDLEIAIKQLQDHYSKTIENNSTYKINFPERELLNFEPRKTLQLLTIINEGLHNAAIHSQANFIFSIASIEDGKLHLITHDNGIGYNRKEISDGNGIKAILKATHDLKGDLKLTSTIGNGTVVNAQIPISKI
ncbi:sensor histidine kinase [Nonlabens ulvanivorans]|uniref:histidine kinase n=1 Tax=Nonlabens ulvanivorans TaxID=906888 RepID=UPI0029428685|nr:histidine kinase [Nonlabens ulvanivorans]WOI21773.1 histidine kinase [Nonlabens ulvanivorans]